MLVSAFDYGSGFFKVFLQLQGVALDGEIQVANDESADDVAHGSARGNQFCRHSARHALSAAYRRQPDPALAQLKRFDR